ncbi:hypothetical protein ACP4OV_013043 [Aristida adscensionis]
MEGDLGWCASSSGSGSSNNWDLHAVVRFACGGAGRVAPPPPPPPPPPPSSDDSLSWLAQLKLQTDEHIDADEWQPPLPADPAAVDDLCQAFFPRPMAPQEQPPETSSPRNDNVPQQPPSDDPPPARPQTSGRSGAGGPARSKRKSKKSQVNKEVTRVAVGAPAPDLWAWRKYGQKPIKGSPYPRGYYRCSTDKECKARKQVERCRADPATLVVTYTGEHSHPVPLHRNSLAGTTRNKTTQPPPVFPADAAEQPQQAAPSSTTSAGLSSTSTNNKPQGSPSGERSPSPTTQLRSPSVEYDGSEEDDDAVFLSQMLEDVMMGSPDDALLFLEPDAPAQDRGGGGGAGDAMPFQKTDDEPPARTDGGAVSPPTTSMDIIEEKFSVSGLSAWEAATSSWGS